MVLCINSQKTIARHWIYSKTEEYMQSGGWVFASKDVLEQGLNFWELKTFRKPIWEVVGTRNFVSTYLHSVS